MHEIYVLSHFVTEVRNDNYVFYFYFCYLFSINGFIESEITISAYSDRNKVRKEDLLNVFLEPVVSKDNSKLPPS